MRSLAAGLAMACGLAAACCLSDRDTPASERAGRPGVYEAVFGFLPKHTDEYYRRRVAAVEHERGDGPLTPALYDDLAVARARLGDSATALRLLREKDEQYPGQLTTAQNLATILAWRGDFGEAAAALEPHVGELEGAARLHQMALRFLASPPTDSRRPATMLGFEVAEKLGAEFRRYAPRTTDADGREGEQQAAILARLELGPEVFGQLAELIAVSPEESEYYFATAELLAAVGDRYLAWHAYQAAWEREHPRGDDIPYYQSQVAEGLDRDAQGRLRPLEYYRIRDRAIAWQKAYQRWERNLLAAGGEPAEPAAYALFLEEHPPR